MNIIMRAKQCMERKKQWNQRKTFLLEGVGEENVPVKILFSLFYRRYANTVENCEVEEFSGEKKGKKGIKLVFTLREAIKNANSSFCSGEQEILESAMVI